MTENGPALTEVGFARDAGPFAPTLIVMALEVEAQGLFASGAVPVLYTGLGKVNAAMSLMRRLIEYRAAGQPPPLVLNFGTAGSRRFATGTLVACQRFVQRDMDVSALGFPLGQTPFEALPAQLEFPVVVRRRADGLVRERRLFQKTGVAKLHCDVIDMEACVRSAKVCHVEGARFWLRQVHHRRRGPRRGR